MAIFFVATASTAVMPLPVAADCVSVLQTICAEAGASKSCYSGSDICFFTWSGKGRGPSVGFVSLEYNKIGEAKVTTSCTHASRVGCQTGDSQWTSYAVGAPLCAKAAVKTVDLVGGTVPDAAEDCSNLSNGILFNLAEYIEYWTGCLTCGNVIP